MERILRGFEQHGLDDNTMIAINSDRGFQLGEDGVCKNRDLYNLNGCIPIDLQLSQVPAHWQGDR